MSAVEVIAEIKSLPPGEQEVVIAFVQRLKEERSAGEDVRYLDPDKAKNLSQKIFSEHKELFRKLAQ